MVLTVSFALSPVIGLFCHRRRRSVLRQLDASVEASGPHDFAVRKHALSSEAPLASTAPLPASVTIAIRPCKGRDGAGYKFDLGLRRNGIFLQRGLDTQIGKLPVGQIRCPVALTSAASVRIAPKYITAFAITGGGRGEPVLLAKLLSYRSIRARGLPGMTRGGGHLGRYGGNKQHAENRQNTLSHLASIEPVEKRPHPVCSSSTSIEVVTPARGRKTLNIIVNLPCRRASNGHFTLVLCHIADGDHAE
jgi:hypothetical protein